MAFFNLKRMLGHLIPRKKSTRISILLGIDTAFFLLEIFVGYAVNSLALVADSFHMLNDVLSLCVGLWAVTVADTRKNSKKYTYGWQRAETLGALVNGVFLVALCLSIFLEGISRLVEPKEVSKPVLVLKVGVAGFIFNILGLFLFHEHGHSHGDREEQPHAGADKVSAAEQGNSRMEVDTQTTADDGGNVAGFLPHSTVGSRRKLAGTIRTTGENSAGLGNDQPKSTREDDDESTAVNSESSIPARKANSRHHRHSNGSRSSFANPEDIKVHPATFRSHFIAASESRLEAIESETGSESEAENSPPKKNLLDEEPTEEGPTESTPLLKNSTGDSSKMDPQSSAKSGKLKRGDQHEGHSHTQPKERNHNHGDLNMRGIFLHVMGDALGNLGVIGSALIIWLTDYWWRFYADPAISLVLTGIILHSAIPLCKAASRVVLQAVPDDINVDDIKRDINRLQGVQNCHHLHVWQLSNVKLIASLHIKVNCDIRGSGSAMYMALAREVNKCLHAHGIHSSTIQPEFLESIPPQAPRSTSENNDSETNGVDSRRVIKTGDAGGGEARGGQVEACLMECGDGCDEQGQCCAPSSIQDDDHNEDSHPDR
ncbi:hypothetical protein MMC07_002646 [Pseudocyphellaria aurata]|nr:hypothetical protein [Pseudocyphellaria aurata]